VATGPSLFDEVTFLAGVDDNNLAAETSFETWNGSTTAPGYNDESSATKWGNATPGTGAVVSYFFTEASNWTDSEEAAWRGGLDLWTAVANITFVEAASAATANFVITRGSDGGAHATFGSQTTVDVANPTINTPPATGSVVSIDTSAPSFGPIGQDLAASGGYPLSTVVHEIGHIIGIGHGGPYNSNVNAMVQQYSAFDTKMWTLMSYISPESTNTKYYSEYTVRGTDWGDYDPLTPMMLDILAVQRLYGAATSGPLAGGNLTFGFNSNIPGYIDRFYDFAINEHPVVTLWAGGTNNTFDVSGFSQNATISLIQATFSSVGGLTNNVAIAYDTVIEKAIGGSGNDSIYASDVASTLIGGGGSDQLFGGAGDDILTGGVAADTINPGGGINILRDTLANMNSDTVFNFGQSTTIEVTGVLIGRDSLHVVHFDGDTTLQMGGSSILLEGSFFGGDFMAVARGAGGGAHTMFTYETFLPALAEGVRVNAETINGVANLPFMTGDGSVRFSMELEAAISTFNNSLGIYKVAADGTIFDTRIVFSDTHNASTASIDLGTPGNGVSIGFFLIQNGFGAYGNLPDNLSFMAQGGGMPANLNAGLPVTLMSATLGALTGAQIFHSFGTLNASDANQVLSGVATGGKDLLIGFEDLPTATGDNDFQDVVIRIHTNHDNIFIV
jgi:hypothetical protein